MRNSIIVFSILWNCTNISWSQSSLFSADSLLQFEIRAFAATNDTAKNEILLNKMNYLIGCDSIGTTTLSLTKRINPSHFTDNEKSNFYWNAALLAYLNHENYLGIKQFTNYEESSGDTSITALFLGYMIHRRFDTEIKNQYYSQLIARDTSFQALDCLSEIEAYQFPNKTGILNSSLFVPGFGLVRVGEIGKGTLAFSLSALSGVAIFKLIQLELYLNAITWGTNLGGKFYLGNYRLTDRIITNKENQKRNELTENCELILNQLFFTYQIKFR